MAARIAVQLLARPVPRLLAEQFRPATRTAAPGWPSSSRPASRLSRASSTCFRCSIRVQSRRQSTTSGSPPPKEPATSRKPDPETDRAPSSPTSSTSSQESSSSSSLPPPQPSDRPDPSLPSTAESLRPRLQARFSHAMDTLQSRLLLATQTLNDLTGYSSIEKIKRQNDQLERELADAQSRLAAARAAYKSLNTLRASTQREANTLLARKDAWSPPDVERFTALYRSEHELDAKVAEATRELTEAEAGELRINSALTTGILRRYHEEQVWSDRIRRMSTWGTWGLMGVNVLLFIGLQFFGEPWKRRKLVERFVEAEKGVWEDVRREVGEVKGLLVEAREGRAEENNGLVGGEVLGEETVRELPVAPEAVEVGTAEMPPIQVEESRGCGSWREVILDPSRWRGAVQDLYSERRIDLRMRDASVLALEGAVAGATVAAGVLFIALRRP